VPPHLRLAPRKYHARELVNLVKESSGKQEAGVKWRNRVSLSRVCIMNLQKKKHIIMIEGEDEQQK